MEWSEIIQAASGIWMAVIASFALGTWRKQIKAQKYVNFVDELTETVNEFLHSMYAPITTMQFAKLEIHSHIDYLGDYNGTRNPSIIMFIKNKGKDTHDKLQGQLLVVRPILSKMMMLVAKGQIYELPDYGRCHDACNMLKLSYEQAEAFCYIIGDTNLNFDNPEAQQLLEKIFGINTTDINNNLVEQNTEYLKFAQEVYRSI